MSATTTATAPVAAAPATKRHAANEHHVSGTKVGAGAVGEFEEGETLYTPWRLAFYDWWVLGVVNSYAWCCPTSTYLMPLFKENVRKNHLDIGVGTGYFLGQAVPKDVNLTLVDNESHALAVAKDRAGRPDAAAVLADVLEPLPLSQKYGSVSMYYLLHCVRASVEDKCKVFSHIKEHMEPDGVLTGANVLGKGVAQDNFFGRFIRRAITSHGIFANQEDNAYDFEKALRDNFNKVETWVVGSVFIFRAEGPKN